MPLEPKKGDGHIIFRECFSNFFQPFFRWFFCIFWIFYLFFFVFFFCEQNTNSFFIFFSNFFKFVSELTLFFDCFFDFFKLFFGLEKEFFFYCLQKNSSFKINSEGQKKYCLSLEKMIFMGEKSYLFHFCRRTWGHWTLRLGSSSGQLNCVVQRNSSRRYQHAL